LPGYAGKKGALHHLSILSNLQRAETSLFKLLKRASVKIHIGEAPLVSVTRRYTDPSHACCRGTFATEFQSTWPDGQLLILKNLQEIWKMIVAARIGGSCKLDLACHKSANLAPVWSMERLLEELWLTLWHAAVVKHPSFSCSAPIARCRRRSRPGK